MQWTQTGNQSYPKQAACRRLLSIKIQCPLPYIAQECGS